MNTTHMSQRVAQLAALSFVLLAPPSHAQSPQPTPSASSLPARPSSQEIERVLTNALLCRWENLEDAESTQTSNYLSSLAKPDHREIDPLPGGPFEALDHVFEEVHLLAVQGFAGAFGWSANGSVQSLSKALRQRGYEFTASKQMVDDGKEMAGLSAQMTVGTKKIITILVPGRASTVGNQPWRPGGVTLSCTLVSHISK